LLDWEYGTRGTKTFRPLFKRLEERFKPKLYCTDHWKVYSQVIPADRLAQNKAVTCWAEGFFSKLRHCFGMFHRRKRIVTKVYRRIDQALQLISS
jgi:IS1 family transposase